MKFLVAIAALVIAGLPSAGSGANPTATKAPTATPGRAASGVRDETPLPSFAGTQVCAACHGAGLAGRACSVDGAETHARSYRALTRPEAAEIAFLTGVVGPATESQLCLGCHATGAEEGPRWQAPTFRLADGVQCEACHGPRGDHARAMRDAPPGTIVSPRAAGATPATAAALRITPREELCGYCHVARPSHKEVLEGGYRREKSDLGYKNPVNLSVSPAGDRLYVAAERGDSVIVIDTATRRVRAEIPVDARPHDVAVSPDGRTLYVTSRAGHSVSAIDLASAKVVARAPAGEEPHAVRVDPSGRRLFVLAFGQDAVSVRDAADLSEIGRSTAGPGPFGAAMRPDGGSLYVTNSLPLPAGFREPHASEITIIDPATARVRRRVLVPDANTLQAIALVPGRDVALFTLMRSKDLVPLTQVEQGWGITNGLGVLWPDGRVDQVLLDDVADSFPDPTGLAVSPDGRFAIVTSAGADRVDVVDVGALLSLIERTPGERRTGDLPYRLGTSARFVVKRIPAGRNPRAVAFSPDGRFAYVAATLDDAIVVIDTAGFTVAGTIPLGGPDDVTELRRGERLFHSAASAFGRQFSCRSCHPEGLTNGLTLDIEPDGLGLKPLNVRSLRGLYDTPPFKWDGSNSSLARQCGPRLSVFFSRIDPPSPENLKALVRYVGSIEQPANPRRAPDGLSAAQRRGKLVFERAVDNAGAAIPRAARCVHCHTSAYRASPLSSGVGTEMWFDAPAVDVPPIDLRDEDSLGPLGIVYFSQDPDALRPLDNAHLRGVRSSPPFLHNGAAPTLEEIWTRFNLYDWHGRTSDLTRTQFNDLIDYLKTF